MNIPQTYAQVTVDGGKPSFVVIFGALVALKGAAKVMR